MKGKIEKFTGEGTVFRSGIVNSVAMTEILPPQESLGSLKTYLERVSAAIEQHSGRIVRFDGDTVVAFWQGAGDDPSHAQAAFDAACAILKSLAPPSGNDADVMMEVRIVLGTGSMGGDFFGPTKQFQIVGAAVLIADHLFKMKDTDGSVIRMSQYTADKINAPEPLQEEGLIKRDGSEDLRVYGYRPAN
ncbi:MAG: adenylate/guanylate cyclase domain-containing protein [Elusimicrobiota bacterium]